MTASKPKKNRSTKRGNGEGSLYKRTAGGVWWYSWWENGNRERRSSGTRDKATAAKLLEAEITRVLRIEKGIDDPTADAIAKQQNRPISEHVAAFYKALATTAAQSTADLTAARVRHIVTDCKADYVRDLTPSAVQHALKHLRDGDKDTPPRSLQTVQHHLRAIKQFTRWLCRDGRAARDALAHVKGVNVNAETRRDLQRERRALSDGEAKRIIRAAERGPVWTWRTQEAGGKVEHAISGPDRAMLYRVALGTGFRRSELASLTPESFDLASNPPTATIQAAYSKHRRQDEQPLPADLAERLRSWLATKPPERPLWDVPRRAAEMLQADLVAAGVPYRDDSGRVADFHSFRHSFVSRVVASGASVKAAQELARHSTPALTIGRYSHTRLHDLGRALEALPDFGDDESEAEAAQATGTDGAVCTTVCTTAAHTSASERIAAHGLKLNGGADAMTEKPTKQGKNGDSDSAKGEINTPGWGGRAAEGTGLENR